MKNINIYLIRHGESTANIIPDQIGQAPDTKLTENGIRQAEKLGNRLVKLVDDSAFIASSSYDRARHTASIVKKEAELNQKINVFDELVEYSPGDWRGKKRSEIYSDIENLKKITYQHMSFVFPGGESYHQVERRASTWLEKNITNNKEILELAENSKHEIDYLVFSHGMTIKCLLHYVLGFDQSFLWKIHLDNTSISHVVFGEKGFHLKSINDTGHLI